MCYDTALLLELIDSRFSFSLKHGYIKKYIKLCL